MKTSSERLLRMGQAILALTALLVLGHDSHGALLPVPTNAQQAATAKMVRDLFAKDYADRRPSARKELSAKLLKNADETKGDAVAYYVIVHSALDAATDGGDIDTSIECIARLGERYSVDSALLEADFVQRIRAKLPQANAESFAQLCLTLADINGYAGHWDAAKQIETMAGQAATSAKKFALADSSKKRLSEIQVSQRQSQAMEGALKRLEADPQDAASLTVAGKGLCFANRDWSHGLALLARGSDPILRELAALDLRGASAVSGWMAIGNRYWEVAAKEQEPGHSALHRRAGYWYAKALPQLNGLEKVMAQKRIDDAGPSAGTSSSVVLGENGHSYARFDGDVSWRVARFLCAQARGHLIIIPSETVQVLATKLAADHNVWIGATDEEKQGEWNWLDGTPLTYTHWASGQPDNNGGVQHWAIIWRGDATGAWDDVEASQRNCFICEWDAGL